MSLRIGADWLWWGRYEGGSAATTAGSGTDLAALVPSDPLYGQQWHLAAVNLPAVWDDYSGAGIRIAVHDTGIEPLHSDLAANYNAGLSIRADGLDPATPLGPDDLHGTGVAGIIAAANNGSGAVGVAWGAELISIYDPLTFEHLHDYAAAALNHSAQYADIQNNSWSYGNLLIDNPHAAFVDNFASTTFAAARDALDNAVSNGRGGLGTIVVQSAGNTRQDGDDVNLHNFQNSRFTIAVAATDAAETVTDYSTPGAALLVAAPGEGIVTTDRSGGEGYAAGDWDHGFSGTSAAAPIVSGVVALMLEANPLLGWRDVQEILAYSARAGSVDTYAYNGAGNWNGGGLHFSHDVGFGLVDALAAVRLAETWTKQSTIDNEVSWSGGNNTQAAIPDGVSLLTSTISVSAVMVLQAVEVHLEVTHPWIGDLQVTLISPSGTRSVLVDRPGVGDFDAYGSSQANISFTLSTMAGWGESAAGIWTLELRDLESSFAGSLTSWTLNLYGDADSADDTYIYTDAFGTLTHDVAARQVLADSDGGTDTINAAAVTGKSTINLNAGTVSSIAGRSLTIAAGSEIENAFGGDGDDAIIGNHLDNHLYGGRGADMLTGGGGDDTLQGGDGADTLHGGDGADLLEGGDGDDWLYAGAGNDTLAGGAGIDVMRGEAGDDVLFGGAGNDFLYGGDGADQLNGGDGVDTIWGEDGDDIIDGGAGNDWLYGGAGRDLVQGGDGNDRIRGDGDADTLYGGEGDDHLDGGDGDDLLYGENGNDTLLGGLGDDTAYGGDGDDWIYGGAGHDLIYGGDGSSRIWGEDGDDTLHGGSGQDTIRGGEGADLIYGGDGDDLLQGDGGHDVVEGGEGADTLYGGDGNDTLSGGAGTDEIHGDGGDDLVHGGDGGDLIFGGAGNDVLHGDADDDVIWGETGNDTLFGGIGNDTLNGGADDDVIWGEAGDDRIYGGSGNDALHGGDGNDIIWGDDGADTILGGLGDDVLYGGGDADLIRGEDGDDWVYAGDGNDHVYGGAGQDVLRGEVGDDVLHGEDGVDFLYGGLGDDTLHGGGGVDTIWGEEGDDWLYGGAGADWLHGGPGRDVIRGDVGNDHIWGNDGADFLYGGNGNDILDGGDGVDTIWGEAGNDVIYGGAGADWLHGGPGQDTLTGGQGRDRFIYSAADEGGDLITDFNIGAAGDWIDLKPLFLSLNYTGGDPVGDGWLDWQQSGTDTLVRLDQNGGGDSWIVLATLQSVTASDLTLADHFIV